MMQQPYVYTDGRLLLLGSEEKECHWCRPSNHPLAFRRNSMICTVALFSDTEVHCGRHLSNGRHAAIPNGPHRGRLCRNVNSICIAPLFIALLYSTRFNNNTVEEEDVFISLWWKEVGKAQGFSLCECAFVSLYAWICVFVCMDLCLCMYGFVSLYVYSSLSTSLSRWALS